jgi:hypothetical protein
VYQNRLLVSAQNCSLNELSRPQQLADLLSATYKKVLIGLPATGLTLVPKSLFSEERIAAFARYLDVKETEKVLAQPLDDQNIIIYKTNANLIAALEKFNLGNTVYTAQGWIKAIAKSNPPSGNLYLEIGKNTVQILYFSLGSLRFYNTFEFATEDELVYFATFVCEELNLKPQQTNLILSGDVGLGDKNMNRLSDFFVKVQLNTTQVLELPGQIPMHKIMSLAALSLCGLSEAL